MATDSEYEEVEAGFYARERREDQRLLDTAREHGYEYPSVPCGDCGEPTYFLPDEPGSQGSGHYLYHDHDQEGGQ